MQCILGKSDSIQALTLKRVQEKEDFHEFDLHIDKSVPWVTVQHYSAEPSNPSNAKQ